MFTFASNMILYHYTNILGEIKMTTFHIWIRALTSEHFKAISELQMEIVQILPDSEGLFVEFTSDEKVEEFWKKFPYDHEEFIEEMGEF